LAPILTHRLYPNAGTPPAASTEPIVRQVTSFDYWQSVHCKADVSQSRNMSGQHWPGSIAGILLIWVGFTQGFHSFTSYRIKQKSKVLIFNFQCDFCDCFHFTNISIRGLTVKILIMLLEGETCFNVLQALSSKTILARFRRHGCTSSGKSRDFFALAMRSATT